MLEKEIVLMGESAKISKGGKVTIPKKIREKFDLEEGDTIYFENENGKLVVYKMKVVR